jgi:hypothetical protein
LSECENSLKFQEGLWRKLHRKAYGEEIKVAFFDKETAKSRKK